MRAAQKIQEFVAHVGDVNCLKIGRSNPSLIATGGEDRKVNIWEVGQMKVLTSLGGHQSSVESLAFDSSEKNVAAGAVGGTVKIWDVDQGKVSKSFAGHRSGVISVEFHPMKGDFVASGSCDTNVKVWDLRRKTCLQSFKGHAKGVCCLAFSPDGKWIASGSEDGEVKLWDLRTGKLLHNFGDHMARITGIQYHPKECMLATSSTDRTMRLWDLDTFHSIDVLGPEISPVRSIAFTPDEESLAVAVSEGVRLWKWEPPHREEIVNVSWSQVHDLAIDSKKNMIVGCSIHQSTVSVHMIDLSLTTRADEGNREAQETPQPVGLSYNMVKHGKYIPSPRPLSRSESFRRSGSGVRSSACLPNPYLWSNESENINPLEYDSDIRLGIREYEEREFSGQPMKGSDPPRTTSVLEADQTLPSPLPTPRQTPRQTPWNTPRNTPRQRTWSMSQAPESVGPGRSEDPLYSARSVNTKWSGQGHSLPNPAGESTARSSLLSNRRSARISSSFFRREPEQTLNRTWSDWTTNNCSHNPMARMNSGRNILEEHHIEVMDEETALSEILEKRDMMSTILSTRLSNLQIVRAFWARGDIRGALRALHRCNDPSVTSDILEAVRNKADVFDLDAIPDILPPVKSLLESVHDKYWMTAMAIISNLLQSFTGIIHDVTTRPRSTIGVDLSFEQRRSKCLAAKSALEDLGPLLEMLSEQKGAIGHQAEELHLQLGEL